MYFKRIFDEKDNNYQKAYDLYVSSFPINKRRSDVEQICILKKETYHFNLIMENGELIGIMLYWDLDDMIYLEHFAILKCLRCSEKESKALELLKSLNKQIILEIENPVDDITKRRYEFYEKNGFILNDVHHIQAKYHLGDEDVLLKILSFPGTVDKIKYLNFYNYMTKEIGISPKFNEKVEIRKLTDMDDYLQVAKLIYMSDKYIYPGWFKSIDEGIKVLAELIKLPTLYNKDNITIAITKNGDIAGAVISCDFPIKMKLEDIYKAFENANVQVNEMTNDIYSQYYQKMDETEGFYVANIAVNENYRKCGIGTTLLNYVVKDKNNCQLECVKDNISAWRVYQRLGFEIVEEYPGVFQVPCYKMIRRK